MTEYSTIGSYAISLAINLTVIGAFFIAGITLAFRSLGSASPRARYIIALAVFFAAALAPTILTLGASGRVVHSSVSTTVREEHIPNAVPHPNQERSVITDGSYQSEGSYEHLSSAKEPELTQSSVGSSPLDALVSLAARSWFGTTALALWAIVSFLLVAREVAGHIRLAQARRAWRLADDRIRNSLAWPGGTSLYISLDDGPCTLGGFRPAVVIPARLLGDMPPDAARVMARHELAHARWRDPLANALLRILRAILWPSLPLWYLERVVRAEREVAADHFAIGASPDKGVGDSAIEYAALLVSVARRFDREAKRWKFGLAATEAGGRTDFEYRIRRLLKPHSKLTRARILLATLAMLLCICGAAFVPVTAKPIRVAFSPADDPLAADTESAEGKTKMPGPLSPNGGLSQSKKGGEAERVIPGTQPDPENKKGVTQDLVHELAALGYSDLSPDQIAAVRTHGVSPAYVKKLASIGYERLTADTLINFRWLGVDSAYIKEMREVGYGGLPANTVIDFRLYGVNPAYIREMAASGFSNIPAKTLVAFRRMGIDSQYVSHIRSAITSSISVDELLSLRRQGITASYIKELKARGYERLTVNQLIELRSQKVATGKS